MALKKLYGSIIKNNKIVISQKEVNMHPLEEAKTKARWAMNDMISALPTKTDQATEHNWLIENGAEFVKLKREEWQKVYDAAQPAIKIAEKIWRDAEDVWNTHAKICASHGLDYDVFAGNAADTLKMKE